MTHREQHLRHDALSLSLACRLRAVALATGVAALALLGCGGDGADPAATVELPSSLFDVAADTPNADVAGVADAPTDTETGLDPPDTADPRDSLASPPDAPPADTAVDDTAAEPDAGPAPPADPTVWFLHLSDTHVTGADGPAAANLAYFLAEVVPTVDPVATLHTGDLVDDGGEDAQWSGYDLLLAAAPGYPSYVELVGNHDKKNGGSDRWTAHALTGQAGAGFVGQLFYDTVAGRIRVVRTDTSDSSWNPTNVTGFFGADQRDALLALPVGDPAPVATIALGHHPMTGLGALSLLGSGDRMREVLAQTGAAAYLCGHVHEPEIAPLDGALVVQAPSLGKPGLVSRQTGFALVALDGGRTVARIVPIDATASPPVAWPLIVRTRPEDEAPPYPRGAAIPVRALAFAPAGVDAVEASIDSGPWVPLSTDGRGRFWGELPPRWLTGAATVLVRATGPDGTRVDEVRVSVAP